MQDPLLRAIAANKDLPEEAQKAAGKAAAGAMGQRHEEFLALLLGLLEKKAIDPSNPKSFLNAKVYDALPERERDAIDLALINLGTLLRHIVDFRLSKATPDSSPHLQSMIDQLWDMKSRIEGRIGDVFTF